MNKYGNKSITKHGIKFVSVMESDFYEHLLQLHDVDSILVQPRFELQTAYAKHGIKVRKIEYIADFQVGNIVYDVKGFTTADFKIKAKIFNYKYPDLILTLITESPQYCKAKYGKWVELEQLKKERKEREKLINKKS